MINFEKLVAGLFFIFVHQCAVAQPLDASKLQTGDLLFQNLDCGPLCDAIEEVTHGFDGKSFSHIGLIYSRHDSLLVIEAIGKDVHLTPLAVFLGRSSNKVYAGRVLPPYVLLSRKAVKIALSKIGIPYDDAFLYNNGKYYCSELIYDAFREANNNKDFFQLEPMTFKQPGKKTYYDAWVSYYKELGIPIPQGNPGINPAGISRSEKIRILNPVDN